MIANKKTILVVDEDLDQRTFFATRGKTDVVLCQVLILGLTGRVPWAACLSTALCLSIAPFLPITPFPPPIDYAVTGHY